MRKRLVEKNEYILNENTTYNSLINSGFVEKQEDNITKLVYFKELYLDIELYIDVIKYNDELIFDDQKNIQVIDGAFGRPYLPFYYSEKGFDFLNQVITEYNSFMDSLVDRDLFSKKNNKVLTKK